jgi:hydroxymethylpyrimidine/phosphomethylpyrimidine kinase
MYMGYFDKEEKVEGDNPPIGIILSKEKDELLVEYATYGMSSQLFVSKYQLYLPNKEELRALFNKQLEYLSLKRIEDKKKSVRPRKKNTKK